MRLLRNVHQKRSRGAASGGWLSARRQKPPFGTTRVYGHGLVGGSNADERWLQGAVPRSGPATRRLDLLAERCRYGRARLIGHSSAFDRLKGLKLAGSGGLGRGGGGRWSSAPCAKCA